jgi:hypothetical protein
MFLVQYALEQFTQQLEKPGFVTGFLSGNVCPVLKWKNR